LLRRSVEKAIHWTGQPKEPAAERVQSAPRILNPVMYPGFRTSWQRRLNAALIARALKRRIQDMREVVVLSAVPIVADLPEHLNVARWVYYCVDDFSQWPGLDSKPLAEMEQKFIREADRIVAAGDNLAARMRKLGREAHVVSHGIDPDHWCTSARSSGRLEGIERPIVLFWGLIDRRLDIDYLRALDRHMTSGTIVLVGPEQDADPGLKDLSRVKRIGAVPYESLPALATQAAVLVMPYADLPVTRVMQPLKLKEYLATGRAVVSSRLPALAGWESCLDVVDSAEQFANCVLARVGAGPTLAQMTARRRLRDETWKAKTQDLANVLFGASPAE